MNRLQRVDPDKVVMGLEFNVYVGMRGVSGYSHNLWGSQDVPGDLTQLRTHNGGYVVVTS